MNEPTTAFTIDNGNGPVPARSFEVLKDHLRDIACGVDDAFLVIGHADRNLADTTYCQAYFDGEGGWDVAHQAGGSGRHYHMEVTGPAAVFHVLCQWLDGSPGFFAHDWSQTTPDHRALVS